jgi:HSP20 family protein
MNRTALQPRRRNPLATLLTSEPFFGILPSEEFFSDSSWLPAVDIREDDQNIIVSADLPGVNENDIEIEVTKKTLNISGQRNQETKTEENGYQRIERRFGSFSRSLNVGEVDVDKTEAKYDNGVLTITLPKLEKQKETHRIEIESKKKSK